MICPKDFKPCCDDLCGGGRCLRTGHDTLERCHACGQIFSADVDCDCRETLVDRLGAQICSAAGRWRESRRAPFLLRASQRCDSKRSFGLSQMR